MDFITLFEHAYTQSTKHLRVIPRGKEEMPELPEY